MEIKRNRFFYKILFNIGIAALSVVLYYFIFSPFLDTPVEYELKKTNKQLNNEYEKMLGRYQLIDSVYVNVYNRDRDIYKRLFNIEPTNISDQYFNVKNQDNKLYNDGSISEILEAFNNKIHELDYNVSVGKKELVELEKKMVVMRRKFDNIPSIQPVENSTFTKNFVSSGIKLNPFYKGMVLHKGLDYAIEEGTRVFATADGVVSRIGGFRDGGGESIEIDHQNGYKTIYSNLGKILVRKNETVDRGDIIAHSGNSGYSFLPHLHYEVLYKGGNKNPLCFIFADLNTIQMYYLETIASQTIQSFD